MHSYVVLSSSRVSMKKRVGMHLVWYYVSVLLPSMLLVSIVGLGVHASLSLLSKAFNIFLKIVLIANSVAFDTPLQLLWVSVPNFCPFHPSTCLNSVAKHSTISVLVSEATCLYC